MKLSYSIALASLLAALMTLAPAYGLTARRTSSGHPHSQTYHDRTPKVHSHGSHPHRG
jgi:hypothetical protein